VIHPAGAGVMGDVGSGDDLFGRFEFENVWIALT
jgi:hypothetical protein